MIYRKKFFTSISNKFFITFVILIGSLLSFQVLIQHFVLDDVYEYYKRKELRSDFSHYIEELNYSNNNLNKANELTEEYINMFERPLVIMDLEGYIYNDEFLGKYFNYVSIKNEEGQTFNIILDEIDVDLKFGSTINIAGFGISSNWIYPMKIETDEEFEIMEDENGSNFEINIYSGKIINIMKSNLNSNQGMELVDQGIKYIFEYKPLDNTNNTQYFEYFLPETNAKEIFLIHKFTLDSKDYYVVTLDYIQSIQEQLGIINLFNLIVFGIGLLLSIFISKFYSNLISKPMIELNNMSQAISKLDFSCRTNINSNDEIGSLAKSLNTVSKQLHNNIESLKEANKQLAINFEKKSKEEQRAKELIMNLSHELNTPLGIISGFNEILIDGINDKEPLYYNEIMGLELERMKILINDMLELSKLEASEYKLEVNKINVGRIINEVLKNYQTTINDKNIILNINLLENNINVMGNSEKLYQVIDNFISNATKYTNDYEYIFISSKNIGGYMKFQFENTCTTITKEDIPNLWTKFYRTNKTSTRKQKGSGLGLSIAKEILALHGSDFGVEKTDTGIRFYFTLGIIK